MRNETLAMIVVAVIGIIAYAVYLSKSKQKVEKDKQKLIAEVFSVQVDNDKLLMENTELSETLRHFGIAKNTRR